MSSSDTTRAQPLTKRELRVIFSGLILAMILAALDQSIVNTALPRMAGDLGGLAHLSWVVTAFMLSSTVATPIWGKLGDMFGRRTFLVICILLFVAASALCGVAQSMGQLIAFRFLQGIGGGGLMTLSQTVIADVVTPRERMRYQGFFTGAFAFSSVAGPLIGGGLTTALSWRWVFYVNVPIGLLALCLILIGLKPSPRKARHSIDYLGALLLAGAAALALLLFSWAGSVFPWRSVTALALGLTSAVLLALFILRETRAAEPLMDLTLFRIRSFTVGAVTTGCMAFAMMSAMVFLPLYFQLVLGLNPAQAGFMLLPQITMMLLSSIFGGRLSSDTGRPKLFMAGGIALEATGLGLLALLAMNQTGIPWFLGALAVLGLGMGVAMPNATAIVQNAVPRPSLGIATSSMSFIRSLGGALGVAVSGGVMSGLLGARLDRLASEIDVQSVIDGGMAVIGTLSPELQSGIAEAFRQSIAVSFGIGGAVMALAFLLAMSLRGTTFSESTGTSLEEPA